MMQQGKDELLPEETPVLEGETNNGSKAELSDSLFARPETPKNIAGIEEQKSKSLEKLSRMVGRDAFVVCA